MKQILLVTALSFLGGGSFAATYTSDPSSFTFVSNSFPSSGTSYTDPHGNTMTIDPTYGGGFGAFGFAAFVGEPYGAPAFTLTFASPVSEAGFDFIALPGEITGATLSNGDSLSTSITTSGFYGVRSSTPFTSVSFGLIDGSLDVTDFRYTPTATPEPPSFSLLLPLLLAGVGALKLRARRAR